MDQTWPDKKLPFLMEPVTQLAHFAFYFMIKAGRLSALHPERNNDHFGKKIEELQNDSLKNDERSKDYDMVQVISMTFPSDGGFFSYLDFKISIY